MPREGLRQPPPAPRKRRLRKAITPTGRVKRKLNFDEEPQQNTVAKKSKPRSKKEKVKVKETEVKKEETPSKRLRDENEETVKGHLEVDEGQKEIESEEATPVRSAQEREGKSADTEVK